MIHLHKVHYLDGTPSFPSDKNGHQDIHTDYFEKLLVTNNGHIQSHSNNGFLNFNIDQSKHFYIYDLLHNIKFLLDIQYMPLKRVQTLLLQNKRYNYFRNRQTVYPLDMLNFSQGLFPHFRTPLENDHCHIHKATQYLSQYNVPFEHNCEFQNRNRLLLSIPIKYIFLLKYHKNHRTRTRSQQQMGFTEDS